MTKLPTAFRTFFGEHAEHWPGCFGDYPEAGPQLILQAYGWGTAASASSGSGLERGRTDLLALWPRKAGQPCGSVSWSSARRCVTRTARAGPSGSRSRRWATWRSTGRAGRTGAGQRPQSYRRSQTPAALPGDASPNSSPAGGREPRLRPPLQGASEYRRPPKGRRRVMTCFAVRRSSGATAPVRRSRRGRRPAGPSLQSAAGPAFRRGRRFPEGQR